MNAVHKLLNQGYFSMSLNFSFPLNDLRLLPWFISFSYSDKKKKTWNMYIVPKNKCSHHFLYAWEKSNSYYWSDMTIAYIVEIKICFFFLSKRNFPVGWIRLHRSLLLSRVIRHLKIAHCIDSKTKKSRMNCVPGVLDVDSAW